MATLKLNEWVNVAYTYFTDHNQGISFSVDAKLTGQNPATNKSTVDLRLTYWFEYWYSSYKTDFYLWGYGSNGWLGYAYREWGNSYTYEGESGTMMTSSVTITHNNDGTGSFSAYNIGGYEFQGMGVPATQFGSGTVYLPTIPRYATVTQTLNDKTETSVTMKWNTDANIDKAWYTIDDTTWQEITTSGTEGTYVIVGLSANTTYSVKTRVRRTDSQLTSDSSALSVTTLAWPYATGGGNFTIGNSVRITLYNPLSRQIQVEMIAIDDTSVASVTVSGTTATGFNTGAAIDRLYASIPNAKSANYRIKTTTLNIIGTPNNTVTLGQYIVNQGVCSPLIGSVTYYDSDEYTKLVTGDDQKIVRNVSTLHVRANGISARQHATLVSAVLKINQVDHTMTRMSGVADVDVGTLDSGTDLTAEVTLTDSRGISKKKSVTVDMVDWTPPTAIITAQRANNFYSETTINVDALYTAIGTNSVNIAYSAYKEGSASPTYSDFASDNVPFTLVLDNNFQWRLQVIVTDTLGGSTTYNTFISRGMPIIYFDRLKSSTGFNCFPRFDHCVEINGRVVEKSAVTLALDTATDVSTVYSRIAMNGKAHIGDFLSISDGFKAEDGADMVMVSGRVQLSNVASQATITVAIGKSTNDLEFELTSTVSSGSTVVDIPPRLISVDANSLYYLFVKGSDYNIDIDSGGTYLTAITI